MNFDLQIVKTNLQDIGNILKLSINMDGGGGNFTTMEDSALYFLSVDSIRLFYYDLPQERPFDTVLTCPHHVYVDIYI
jgi:hypothetical protein